MLEGRQINLKCLEENHLDFVAEWRNQKDIRRFFFDKSLVSSAAQQRWFERYLQDTTRQIFVAVSRQTKKPVGMIGLYQIDHKDQKAEIGSTMIAERSMQGKGLAAEMVQIVLTYAFEDVNLNRIYAYAVDYNVASIRVKEKCGFRLEGTLREGHYANGRFHDVLLYAITRKEWGNQSS